MAKKLKCWKKAKKHWYNPKTGGKVEVDFNDYTGLYHTSTPKVNKGFEKKSSALKFAKSYMKRHNKC
jgi:hypothetical protein